MAAFSFLAFCLYFSPSLVALLREHPRAGTIFLLNLCFSWTVVGWVAVMIWAWADGKSVD